MMPKVTWRHMDRAPKDGTRVKLYIPYDRSKFTEAECTDEGWWSAEDDCWRYDGDDGPDDIQPTMWRPKQTE
jgi:hypothetical protein